MKKEVLEILKIKIKKEFKDSSNHEVLLSGQEESLSTSELSCCQYPTWYWPHPHSLSKHVTEQAAIFWCSSIQQNNKNKKQYEKQSKKNPLIYRFFGLKKIKNFCERKSERKKEGEGEKDRERERDWRQAWEMVTCNVALVLPWDGLHSFGLHSLVLMHNLINDTRKRGKKTKKTHSAYEKKNWSELIPEWNYYLKAGSCAMNGI